MSTLADRLKRAMDSAGISGSELARLASTTGEPVSQQNVQHLTSGRSKASKHLPAIAQALAIHGIRIEWLLSNRGQMRMDSPVGTGTLSYTPRGAVSSDSERYMAEIAELEPAPEAGAGSEVMEYAEVIRTWRVPRNVVSIATESPVDRIKILRIKGDSMAPTFMPLDRIMVDTTDQSPSPGGVFVVWDGLGLVVKRVQLVPHSDPMRVKITSDNPKFDPYERILGEAYIQGRVIGKWLWV
jgi:phage repressor protein C with HTH and peptisase S24 domain